MEEDRKRVISEAYRLGLILVRPDGAIFAFGRPSGKGMAYMARTHDGGEQIFDTKKAAIEWLKGDPC